MGYGQSPVTEKGGNRCIIRLTESLGETDFTMQVG